MLEPIEGLRTITIGSQDFYNIAPIVGRDRYRRYATAAIDVHHTAGRQTFASAAEEVAHIVAIDVMHRADPAITTGFAYQAIAFPSGRVYVVGDTLGARQHVAGRNGEDVGIVMAGTYSIINPPVGCIFGVGRFILATLETHGLIPVRGHRAAPGQATECPGDAGMAAIPAMLNVATWIKRLQKGC